MRPLKNQELHSSSDEDERAHLKPMQPANSAASAALAQNLSAAGAAKANKIAGSMASASRRRYSGATSPNESDNTYAEANLLTGSNGLRGYDPNEYDSDLYANGDLVSSSSPTSDIRFIHHNHSLGHPHQPPKLPSRQLSPDDGTGNQRYGSRRPQQPNEKSPFLCSSGGRSSSSSGAGTASRRSATGSVNNHYHPGNRGAQLVLSERGWEHLGPGSTGSMVETRLGREQEYLGKYGNPYSSSAMAAAATLASDKRLRQQLQQQKLHRRSMSDDSLGIEKPGGSTSNGGGTSTTTGGSSSAASATAAVPQPEPVVMPGFPVRTLQGHPPPPYSPEREKFLLGGSKCRFHCSWKVVALALTVLTLVLSSVIAYFGAVRYQPTTPTLSTGDSAAVQQQALLPPEKCLPVSVADSTNAGIPQQQQQPPSSSAAAISISSSQIVPLVPGQWHTERMQPFSFWRGKLEVQKTSAIYQMNLTFLGSGPQGGVAVYGRRGAAPSVTTYDWAHIVNEEGATRRVAKRAIGAESREVVSLERTLSRGKWFLSVFNDHPLTTRTLRTVINERAWTRPQSDPSVTEASSSGSAAGCPKDCHGRGECHQGECRCQPQYSGVDCSISVCPLLCSGHGFYGGGKCHCQPEWKGAECELHAEECLVADCSGHGSCRDGVCICSKGWTGERCDQKHCPDPSCSGHGQCGPNGQCHCDLGWVGRSCESRNAALDQCVPDCSGHGRFHHELGRCECHDKWTGRDCNITVCSIDCGPNGQCLGSSCACQEGWHGNRCELRACDPRCELHGKCNARDGTCICRRGWNGRHCGLAGCGPRGNCHGHGHCLQAYEDDPQRYSCQCKDGWTGEFCQFPVEQNCEDGEDNDKNGLVDCADSQCCSHPPCAESVMCVFLADPASVLLRKPPPAVSASFFQRVQFLFEGEDSVQSYVKRETFDENRVSIVRGRVMTITGQGIIGVRVSISSTREATSYGFTLTRPEGWFDLAVNGGGAVTLKFQRSPLKSTTRTTNLPWNQILVISPVVMTPDTDTYDGLEPEVHGIEGSAVGWFEEEDFASRVRYMQPCPAHNPITMVPKVFSSYVPNLSVSTSATSAVSSMVFSETQVLEESILIPGTAARLVYRSSSAPGAASTLHLLLTPKSIPPTLLKIHLVVRVSGNVFRKAFEAEPDLEYVYAWDKKNVYDQKVYGTTEATVSVGYVYQGCGGDTAKPLWTSRTARMRGYEVDVSDVAAGWNLDLHHHYNQEQGILQKGNGEWVDFADFPRMASFLVGTGTKRDPSTSKASFSNPAEVPLLSVLSLTSGPDGSLYFGDYEVIRKLSPDGQTLETLFTFGNSEGAFHYDLKISPWDGSLYLAHAQQRKVLRLLSNEERDDLGTRNFWQLVAGTGQRCLPGDSDTCGDGGPATRARLTYPKGLALAVDRTIYVSDGRSIRVILPDGKIQTLLGGGVPNGPPKPLPCSPMGVWDARDVQLQWPTRLELSPLDGTLHIVDDTMVLRLTQDMKVQVTAGKSPLCNMRHESSQEPGTLARETSLGQIQDFAFAADGTLYLAEKTSANPPKGVLVSVDQYGTIDRLTQQSRATLNCTPPCNMLIDKLSLQSPGAVSVTPDGNIQVADNAIYRLISLNRQWPQPAAEGGDVNVADVVQKELYTFNRYGHHTQTHSLETGALLASFAYSKNTHLGRLTGLSDALGNKLSLQRDYTKRVKSVENSAGQKFKVALSRLKYLESFELGSGSEVTFGYSRSDTLRGLLTSRLTSDGDFRLYKYTEGTGRVSELTTASGETLKWTASTVTCAENEGRRHAEFSPPTLCVKVMRGSAREVVLRLRQSGAVSVCREQDSCRKVVNSVGSALSTSVPKVGRSLSLDGADGSLQVLHRVDPILGILQRSPTMLLTYADSPNATPGRLEWQYDNTEEVQLGKGSGLTSRALVLNREQHLLGLHYDASSATQTIVDGQGRLLLRTHYSANLNTGGGVPVSWETQEGHNCTAHYDRLHRVSRRLCGQVEETFSYDDRTGRIIEHKTCRSQSLRYAYGSSLTSTPSSIYLPSGREFIYSYDKQGGLSEAILPTKKASFEFAVQPTFGGSKVMVTLPGATEPFVTIRNAEGYLLEVRPPGSVGLRIFSREPDGTRLREVVSGFERVEYSYDPHWATSDPPCQIELDRGSGDFTVKLIEQRLMDEPKAEQTSPSKREQRITFSAQSGFAGAKFVLDESSRRLLSGRIGGSQLPSIGLQRAWGLTGTTMARPKPGSFMIRPLGRNETTITDSVASFVRSDALEELRIHGRWVYRAEMEQSDACFPHKLSHLEMRTRRDTGEYLKSFSYKYDEDGQLVMVSESGNGGKTWKFKYDPTGNLVTKVSPSSERAKTHFRIDPKSLRIIETVGESVPWDYDLRGRVISNPDFSALSYSPSDQLVSVTLRGRKRSYDIVYEHDHLGRLIGWTLDREVDPHGHNTTQFFYADADQPYRPSHVYRPRQGLLTSLLYDPEGRLFFAQVNGRQYYVLSDLQGSPMLFFSESSLVREVARAPFGQMLFDSEPGLGWEVPIGFSGGIFDRESGLIFMQGPAGSRPYDPVSSSYLTPKWWSASEEAFRPLDLTALYRLDANDPVNIPSQKMPQGPREQIAGIGRRLQEAFPSAPIASHDGLRTEMLSPKKSDPLSSSAAALRFSAVLKSFEKLGAATASKLLFQPVNDNDFAVQVSRLESPLGPFIALDPSGARVRVISVNDSSNEVPRTVFGHVLNGSTLLDFRLVTSRSASSSETFFFIKNPLWHSSEDIQQLRRLGPGVNLTMHEMTSGPDGATAATKVLDVKVHLLNTVINIRYGVSASSERLRLLRHSLKVATRRLWIREKSRLQAGLRGGAGWSPRDRAQILGQGYSDGWDTSYRWNVQTYPELANDLDNLEFVPKKSKRVP